MVKGKRNRRRRYNKGGKKLATRNYVKKICNSKDELKKADMGSTAFTVNANRVYVFNPTYQTNQGTGSNQRIGRVITDCVFNLSFSYTHMGRTSVNADAYPSSLFRLLVLSSGAVKTGVAAPNAWQYPVVDMAAGDIFYTTDRLAIAPVNTSRWTVLKDITWESHRVTDQIVGQAATGNTVFRKNIRIPIHKRCTFRSLTTNSVLTEKEVYICLIASGVGMGLNDQAGYVQTEGLLTYRDA